MAQLQVTCINKTNRFNPHERIQNIGGPGFKFSQPDAIRCIEQGIHSFYVTVGAIAFSVTASTYCAHSSGIPGFLYASDRTFLMQNSNSSAVL